MSLVNATDTGGSSQSTQPVTPARNRLSTLTSSLATDTPMSSGTGDPNFGYSIVKDLAVRLKTELKRHHVQDVEIPSPVTDARTKIEKFLRSTPLYDDTEHRWVDVPFEPKNEKELYGPHTAIINAIIDRFGLSNRRLIMAANITIHHETHEREKLATRPDYLIVGRGPLVNGRSRFGNKDNFDNEWAVYDHATTVGDGKTEDNAAVLDNGIQLAVYARACFIQQCNRDFVFGFIMTEKYFRVYSFDRCGMMSTVRVDYHADPVPFVHAICLIASTDADAIGYNPTIYYDKNKAGKITRFLTSTFLRPRTNRDPDHMKDHVEEDDLADGLAHISVDEVKYVEEEMTFCVHKKPLHVRRGVRGRGGVYWSADREGWGAVLVKQAYVPVGRVPEWKYLKKAVGLIGVGQMLAYDTRSWTYCCVVLKRYGKSVAAFKTRRELLVAFRDAINGHWNLWKIDILHRDVSIHNILLGVDGAEAGWEGVLIDLDMAISMRRTRSDLEADFRTGTRAFQSVQVLRSYECNLSDASSEQRFMHDYADDLEAFYWCLCWICFSFDGPGVESEEENLLLKRWQHDDPREAYDSKSNFLEGPFKRRLVKRYFQDDALIELLEFLHAVFQVMYAHKSSLVETGTVHNRTLEHIQREAKDTYERVIKAFNRAIDRLGPEGMPAKAESTELPFVLPQLPDGPRQASRAPGQPSTSISLGNKRKASEESDEAPEKKKAVSTAPLISSSLRHSESYDP
ncbi:uncharacterized protein SCHCODRAFT_02510924 [Schizophyllum commune H4-8]|uniref:uncharacterized protein n=1 Tax=Schizophyllum commune (strain H4-8 / FGSC 9210) TaxID=578458 RepID=UPI002160E31B|nr:uncharacterized protein SCHCODRAFT_02510924 [Schizophyllum commune H4-8]KAI5888987.1 hypothetical protein SCHCODRAFT_02510924 [Schizophyllum commune H4-8]